MKVKYIFKSCATFTGLFKLFLTVEKREEKKVTDVEHDYLGYAVHWPTGIPVTDQHTEIEMGAEESERCKVC